MSTETNVQPLTLLEASTLEGPATGAAGVVSCPETVEALPIENGRCREQRSATIPVPALADELRPRERLLYSGAGALSAAELLALVLGGEARGSLDLAADVISQSGGLAGLRAASYHDLVSPGAASPEGASPESASPESAPPEGAPPDGALSERASLTEVRTCKVLAAIELGKRMMSARGPDRAVISSPADLHAFLEGCLRDLDREHLVAVLLDSKNQVLAAPTVSVGTLASSPVHPREVFKPAIKASAASVILAHNHPSGQRKPSATDREVTQRLRRAGEEIGIEVLDHVIFGADGYTSLKESGML